LLSVIPMGLATAIARLEEKVASPSFGEGLIVSWHEASGRRL